jgi:hypothetical protein
VKLNKSTTFLLNVILVLFIVFLVKSLLIHPKEAQAGAGTEYLFTVYDPGGATKIALTETLNKFAQEGWKLHTYQRDLQTGNHLFIFER